MAERKIGTPRVKNDKLNRACKLNRLDNCTVDKLAQNIVMFTFVWKLHFHLGYSMH